MLRGLLVFDFYFFGKGSDVVHSRSPGIPQYQTRMAPFLYRFAGLSVVQHFGEPEVVKMTAWNCQSTI
jgi:hypothetical protein